MYGILWKWDDKDTKEILGLPGRDVKTAVEEMAESLIKSVMFNFQKQKHVRFFESFSYI